MTQQLTSLIFAQNQPSPFQYVRMYVVPELISGISGQLLVVNQGNPQSQDFNTETDIISVGLSPSNLISFPDSWIAWNTALPPGHMTQFQGLCLAPGQTLFIYNAKGQCSFTFTGTSYGLPM